MSEVDLDYQRRVIEASLGQMLKQVERLSTLQQELRSLTNGLPYMGTGDEADVVQAHLTDNQLPQLTQSINNLRDLLLNLERGYQTIDTGDLQARNLVAGITNSFKRIY